jgi:hypothetical protein
MRRILLSISFIVFYLTSSSQNIFTSVQNGDWDDASTWFTGAATGGIEGINFPSSSDSVIINHDVKITATNSGADFVFEGYLRINAGNELRCTIGTSTDGFLLTNNGVMHVYGSFYTAIIGEGPSTNNPAPREFFTNGDAVYVAFTGSSLFVSDDWEIQGNSTIYIEDNVCLRVDDDVNFNGTGWFMCGDGDISIGGDGAGSNVSFGGGSSNAQICSGTSIIRNTVSTDCSAGTTVTTGSGGTGSAPNAIDDKAITEINTPADIQVLYFGVDDNDISLDTLEITSAGSNGAANNNTTAQGGTLSINNNGTPLDFTDDFITYTPPAGFTGTDSFDYIITDEENLTDRATVTIDVINCGGNYVELLGTGANGSTTSTLNFSDVGSIDSIVCEIVYKGGKPTFTTFTSSTQTVSGVDITAINGSSNEGVYRATLNGAASITATHNNASGVRSFLAYVYRSGGGVDISSKHNRSSIFLFENSYSYTEPIPSGTGLRDIRIQLPISELNPDSRSALFEVKAGPVSGSLETFTQDLGNSLKIFTIVLEDVPGDVTELEVIITSKIGGAGDSFITNGINFGIQCNGTAPDANPDNASTSINTPVTVNILNNDDLGSSPFDLSTLTNLGVLDPQNGSVTFNGSGQAVYTPDPGFTGIDFFQYEICDTRGLCSITTVTITVTCANGLFVDVAEPLGLDLGGSKDGGLTWADFNDDGLLDVLVNTSNGTFDSRLYFSSQVSGKIEFTDVTATHAAGLLSNTVDRSAIAADFNNDGYVDILRNRYNNVGIEIYFNRGPGASPAYSFGNASQGANITKNTFSTSNSVFNTEGIAVGDWNQDGWLDIFVENDGGGIEILENNRNGTFGEIAHATTGFPVGNGGSGTGDYSSIVDFDNDGYIDYAARRANESDLYRFNPSTNSFDVLATPNLSTNNSEKGAVTFCDLDNDGDFDLIWAHNSDDNQTKIYTQDNGVFTFATNLVNDAGVEECDCADIDNDGDNDIFLGDDGGNSYLFKNNTPKRGSLSFTQDNDCIAPGADVEGSEFVDYDNDGDMDLYMNINNGDNQLWHNGQDDNNFLKVEPRYNLNGGKWRSAIGANVVLVANCQDTCMIMDVSGGRGHGSQKPGILHFGLADGPDKRYKVVTYFVNENGSRETVVRTVVPSELENQTLIVYDTDQDLDLCADADNDGVIDLEDLDDDNDGIPDSEENDCGNTTTLGIANTTTATTFDGDLTLGVNTFTGFTTADGLAYDVVVTTSIENSSPNTGDGVSGVSTIDGYTGINIAGERFKIQFVNTITRTPISLKGFDFRVSDFENSGGFLENLPFFSFTTINGNTRTFGNGSWTEWEGVNGINFGNPGSQLTTNGDGDLISNYSGLGSNQPNKYARLDVSEEYINTIEIVQHNTSGGSVFGWISSNLEVICDSDNDGIPNQFDLDSDNDGIPDIVEAGGEDTDGDGKVDDINSDGTLVADVDGDGLADKYDPTVTGNSIGNIDSDGDGLPNAQDLDSDNDGIPDVVESGGTDSNGDGRLDGYVDTDFDGLNDLIDGDVGQDGVAENSVNALILTGEDTNGDGAPDSFPNGDFDGDNVYNYVDLDADDDGILDVIEAGGTDLNQDGQADDFVDTDKDGFNDTVDGDPNNSLQAGDDSNDTNFGNVLIPTGADTNQDGNPDSFTNGNTDGDNNYNFLDIDSDNDGITDNTEGQGTFNYIAPSNSDSDGDGIDDAYDSDDASFGGEASSFLPIDSDAADDPNTPDYLDIDSDEDGELDRIEGHDANGDGTADSGSPANTGLPSGTTDNDGDGLYDGWDNNTSSKDPTNSALNPNSHPNADGASSERDWREVPCVDTDGDGICNSIDIDDDNDGILDTDEDACSNTTTLGFANTSSTTEIDGDFILGINTFTGYTTSDGTPYSVIVTTSIETLSPFNGDGISNEQSIDGFVGVSISGERFNIRFVHAVTGNPVGLSGFDFRVSDLESDATFIESIYQFSYTTIDGSVERFGNGKWNGWEGENGINFGAVGSQLTKNNNGNLTTTYIGAAGNQADKYARLNIPDAVITEIEIAQHNANGGSFFGWRNTSLTAACDKDQDGIPNSLDLDSDDDGIADIVEAGGVDANNDGVVDGMFADTDSDGWSNVFDPNNGGTVLSDQDVDGDGLPNRVDLDADNDGIADIIEAGGVDSNNDGKPGGVDADFNGWTDNIDGNNGGSSLPTADFDGDGIPNYLDIDSDNDGLIDNVEGQSTAAFVAPTGADTDNDGWDNRYDSDNGGTAISLNNQEGNGNPDYLDLDTDGDGQPDWIEGFDDDQGGLANDGDALNDYLARANAFVTAGGNSSFYNNSLDTDSDGIPNWLEDADLDGQPNFIDPQSSFYRDTDNDGLVDLFDTDNFGSPSTYPNKDNDLEPDWRDTDNATTLPITLLSFDAEKKVAAVMLRWTTVSEINNDYFTVEKSKDGLTFNEVGMVDGAGNSSTQLEYKLLDESPYSGISYYRLKQTDFNGDFTYSELRAVEFVASQLVESSVLYPNPTTGEQLFFNHYSEEQGELVISIRTLEGQLIAARRLVMDGYATNYEVELLRGLSLAKGTYLVSYVLNEKVIGSKQFVVK